MRELSADEIEIAVGGSYIILKKMVEVLMSAQAMEWGYEKYRSAINSVDNSTIEQTALARWAGEHYSQYGFCNY